MSETSPPTDDDEVIHIRMSRADHLMMITELATASNSILTAVYALILENRKEAAAAASRASDALEGIHKIINDRFSEAGVKVGD